MALEIELELGRIDQDDDGHGPGGGLAHHASAWLFLCSMLWGSLLQWSNWMDLNCVLIILLYLILTSRKSLFSVRRGKLQGFGVGTVLTCEFALLPRALHLLSHTPCT